MATKLAKQLAVQTIDFLIAQCDEAGGWQVSRKSPVHFIAEKDGVRLDVFALGLGDNVELIAERMTLTDTTESTDQVVSWIEDKAS